MQPKKVSHFTRLAYLLCLLVFAATPPAYAASDTAFNKLTAGGLLAGLLFFLSISVGIMGLIVLVGHYGFKANRVIAERICYSLSAILLVKAGSESYLPPTAATILALVVSALTYYLLARLKPNR